MNNKEYKEHSKELIGKNQISLLLDLIWKYNTKLLYIKLKKKLIKNKIDIILRREFIRMETQTDRQTDKFLLDDSTPPITSQ